LGRQIKRVPVDFDHPVHQAWPGFVRACDIDDCEGCPDCANQEPPSGEAWQVWETVSEGSPISPPFVERDACVAWLIEHEKCSPAAAEQFITDGWAPSMIGTPFGVFMGVQAAAGIATHIEWLHVQDGDYTTLPAGTPIRHLESGITGTVTHRFAPPNGGFYFVTWSRGLPSLLAEHPDDDPDIPMMAASARIGFEVIE
jgi:hypothetical protein